jgi:UDP-GlcNAc:undecaprenyl-phosphate GlcNAc-1-phosphate transferase
LGTSLVLLVFSIGLWKDSSLNAVFIPAVIIFIFGLWDDRRRLSPLLKFAGQLIATLLLISSGVYIRIFESPTFFIGGVGGIYVWLDRMISVLWIVGVTNAFNLVDSMDGLGIGLSTFAFGFFMLVTFDSGQFTLAIFCALILGVCIALNFYNASPAKLFMGDSGDLTLGFLLAALAILYTPQKVYQSSSWFIPILLAGIPIFDTSLVFFSRLRRGKPFYGSGSDHTYHRLVAWGLDPSRAVLGMHLAALLLECLAFVSISLSPLPANLIFIFCLVMGGTALIILDNRKRWP